jgi:endonuclease/exonuclease/phosphatase family metal-dependent hydrolase
MPTNSFTVAEWDKINATLEKDPVKFGFSQRIYGSAVVGSFNIRKLGNARGRNAHTWKFLARVCGQYDLLAVQEVLDDLSGLRRIMHLLGPDFGMIVSGRTGAFPGGRGLAERLAFIFRWSIVCRGEVVSDISYDRTKVLETIAENFDDIKAVMQPYSEQLARFEAGPRRKPKLPTMPVFLSFIRQPFCVSFKIVGFPGTRPYSFMAVNAHLMYGKMRDRRKEFDALMDWIRGRVKQVSKTYYPNFMLLGDLNLDFDNPRTDRERIEAHLKTCDDEAGDEVSVNFPFLETHPGNAGPFRTNARESQTFDHIGLFFRERGLPMHVDNKNMGKNEIGPDYGVFNFVNLFQDALGQTREDLYPRFENKVSDHLPLWLRLPLPKD